MTHKRAEAPPRIASFTVDHDCLRAGLYVSRVDGDVTTYDLRTRRPNGGDYMDNLTMHSVEHLFATYVRAGRIGAEVLYFGPMGCQTGFYLLVRGLPYEQVRDAVIETLEQILSHEGAMFGASHRECGNYRNLNVEAAQLECARYLAVLRAGDCGPAYPTAEESGRTDQKGESQI